MNAQPTLTELEQSSPFENRHIGPDAAAQEKMLAHVGYGSLDLLSDLYDCEDGRLADVGVGVLERSDQRIDRAGVADLAESVRGLLADFGVGILERRDERVYSTAVAQLSKRVCGLLPYVRVGVFERLGQCAHILGIAHPADRRDRLLPHVRRFVLEHPGDDVRGDRCAHPHQRVKRLLPHLIVLILERRRERRGNLRIRRSRASLPGANRVGHCLADQVGVDIKRSRAGRSRTGRYGLGHQRGRERWHRRAHWHWRRHHDDSRCWSWGQSRGRGWGRVG